MWHAWPTSVAQQPDGETAKYKIVTSSGYRVSHVVARGDRRKCGDRQFQRPSMTSNTTSKVIHRPCFRRPSGKNSGQKATSSCMHTEAAADPGLSTDRSASDTHDHGQCTPGPGYSKQAAASCRQITRARPHRPASHSSRRLPTPRRNVVRSASQ